MDTYKFVKNIQEGSFAKVYVAKTSKSDRQFAVKRIVKNNSSAADFWFESSVLELVTEHRNVVKLVETIDTPKHFYLVQELCDQDLFDRIAAGLDPHSARRLFIELCDAVAHCHSLSIFHRDLKPENVLLKDGEVKLADFGLSTADELSDEFMIGSYRYMSPEVFNKNEADGILCDSGVFNMPYSSPANDVWALGVILVNMLTGKCPWEEPTLLCSNFKSFRNNPEHYLASHFKFSKELINVLKIVFSTDPFSRPSAQNLGRAIRNLNEFFIKKEERKKKFIIEHKTVMKNGGKYLHAAAVAINNTLQKKLNNYKVRSAFNGSLKITIPASATKITTKSDFNCGFSGDEPQM